MLIKEKRDGRVLVDGRIAVCVDGKLVLGYAVAEKTFGFTTASLSNRATTVASGKIHPFTLDGRSVTHPNLDQVRRAFKIN